MKKLRVFELRTLSHLEEVEALLKMLMQVVFTRKLCSIRMDNRQSKKALDAKTLASQGVTGLKVKPTSSIIIKSPDKERKRGNLVAHQPKKNKINRGKNRSKNWLKYLLQRV